MDQQHLIHQAVTIDPPSRSIGSTAIFFHDPFCWTVGKIWLVDGQEHKQDFEDFANRSIVSVSTLQELVSREHDHDDGLAVNGPGSRFPAAGSPVTTV